MFTKTDMIHDLSAIWSAVNWIFPYFERLEFDWDKTYLEYLDKIDSIESEYEFHCLLKDFLNLLNDGHTKYTSPDSCESDSTSSSCNEQVSYSFENHILTIQINHFMQDCSEFVAKLLTSFDNIELVRIDVSKNIGGNSIFANAVAKLFISGQYNVFERWQQIHVAHQDARYSQICMYSPEFLEYSLANGLVTAILLVKQRINGISTGYIAILLLSLETKEMKQYIQDLQKQLFLTKQYLQEKTLQLYLK